jgi:hypothetical protein
MIVLVVLHRQSAYLHGEHCGIISSVLEQVPMTMHTEDPGQVCNELLVLCSSVQL